MEDINGRSSEFGTLHCGVATRAARATSRPASAAASAPAAAARPASTPTRWRSTAAVVAGADPLVPRRQQLLHRQRQPGRRDHLEQRHPPRVLHHPQRGDRRRLPGRVRRRPHRLDRVRRADDRRLRRGVHRRWRRGGGDRRRPPAARPITNANGLCLDVRSSSTANGNPVQIYTCNGTAAQQWTYVEAGSTLHVLGKCLDITGGGTANGTKVQLWDCNNTGAQVLHPPGQRLVLQPAVQPVPGRPERRRRRRAPRCRSGTATAAAPSS